MIKLNNVKKLFGDQVANENINLEIKSGEIFGILGPNGAGKTTLISQVMGFIKSDDGWIEIEGLDSWKDSKKIMKDVGFIAGEIKLYESMKVKDFIKIYKDFNAPIDDIFLGNLIKLFELDLNKKIKLLSKGNKQKVSIVCAIMSKPKILILDEPTSGLDPIMQEKFASLIFELKKHGTTIILCSHIFKEVEKLCDRVAFLKSGRLVETIVLDENNKKNLESNFNRIFSDSVVDVKEMFG